LNQKLCSKCLRDLHICEFYQKRGQLDSQCKSCKKIKRRSIYTPRKGGDFLGAFIAMAEIVHNCETRDLGKMCERLDEILCQCPEKKLP
jgi:hypothetical protein